MTDLDCRSVCVLAEPIFGSDGVQWRAMAFVGGRTVNNITGHDRAIVLDDCLSAVADAGVNLGDDDDCACGEQCWRVGGEAACTLIEPLSDERNLDG